jgi:hypothetical protein
MAIIIALGYVPTEATRRWSSSASRPLPAVSVAAAVLGAIGLLAAHRAPRHVDPPKRCGTRRFR